jgi:hypothetical protein
MLRRRPFSRRYPRPTTTAKWLDDEILPGKRDQPPGLVCSTDRDRMDSLDAQDWVISHERTCSYVGLCRVLDLGFKIAENPLHNFKLLGARVRIQGPCESPARATFRKQGPHARVTHEPNQLSAFGPPIFVTGRFEHHMVGRIGTERKDQARRAESEASGPVTEPMHSPYHDPRNRF